MENTNGNVFQLNVNRGEPTSVLPAKETQKGLYFLSNLDQNIAVIVRTIYCFKSDDKGNEKAGEVIKTALEKVLVHYYPLAGRLTISSMGNLIVNCNGEGVVFVKAEANYKLEHKKNGGAIDITIFILYAHFFKNIKLFLKIIKYVNFNN